MFPLIYLTALIVSWQPPAVRTPSQISTQEIRTRLDAQEKRSTGGPDPAAFGSIARLAFERATQSRTFRVWFEACAAQVSGDQQDCPTRLWGVLKNVAAPLKDRASAGAALVARKDPSAAAVLAGLVKNLNTKQLAEVAPELRVLPPPQAVPLLRKLLASNLVPEQVAACRSLGTIDTAEVRSALRDAVAQAPPSTDVWNACMVARARLKEPDSVNTMSGYTHYMSGEPLLEAAQVMLLVGNEQGIDVLKKVTREASPLVQLRAAAELTASDREYVARILEPRLQDANPAVRAEALVVERKLSRTPSVRVRSMLVDTDELVQLRAAEALLDWAEREASRWP